MQKNPKNKFDSNQRADFRRRLAKMALFGGMGQREMADRLGVSQTLICFELKKLRKQWMDEAKTTIDEVVSKELKKLDDLELESYQAWLQSKKRSKKKIIRPHDKDENGNPFEQVETTTSVGNPTFLAEIRHIQERRAKLLGFDKPEKVAQTTPEGNAINPAALSDSALAEIMAARYGTPDETIENVISDDDDGSESATDFNES